MAERRSMERFNLHFPVMISAMGKDQEVFTKEFVTSNICAGGAYFITSKPFLLGTKVQIDLPWPPMKLKLKESRKALIKLQGKVVRASAKGMAIAFSSQHEIIPAV